MYIQSTRMSKQLDNIPLEAVLFDKEVIYHITRDEIFEAVFDKDRGVLKEKKRPYREFTSATAFVNGHVTSPHNGRLVCKLMRGGVEYTLKDLYEQIRDSTGIEAKVTAIPKSKEEETMPPPKKATPVQIKGLIPVKHPESIVARIKESDKPPIELTSVSILKVIEYEWQGSHYWFDETNRNLYTMNKIDGLIGDLIGQLNEKGQLTMADK